MLCPLRIGYVTAMWQRPQLTKVIFQHVAELKKLIAPAIELIPTVAGSEGQQSREIAESSGFLYTEVPNSPLGAKWNAALRSLKTKNIDGICIFGSDDLVNKAYFDSLLAHLRQGFDLLGMDGIYFFDQLTGRMFDWGGYFPPQDRDTCGAGRFIHRRYIEKLQWQLWPKDIDKWLDRAMQDRLKQFYDHNLFFHQMPHRKNNIIVADIKSSTIMSSIESVVVSGPTDIVGNPYQFFVKNFGETLASVIFTPETPRLHSKNCSITQDWNALFSRKTIKEDDEENIIIVNPFSEFSEVQPHFAYDFSVACHTAGKNVIQMDVRKILEHRPSGRSLLYLSHLEKNGLNVLSKLCNIYGPHQLIIDCRDISKQLLDILRTLPVKLIGAEAHEGMRAEIWPLPFNPMSPPLSYEQRAHILAYLGSFKKMNNIINFYLNSSTLNLTGDRLFIAASYFEKKLQPMGIYFFDVRRLYEARQVFRAVVIDGEARNQYYIYILLSAGTPVICIGTAPDNLGPSQGVFSTRNYQEAFKLLNVLTTKPSFWNTSSEAAYSFAKTKYTIFSDKLNKDILNI